MNTQLAELSQELADAVENASKNVVAVNARWRFPSSGVFWRPGLVIAADHTIKREDDIGVTLPDGRSVSAKLAGRDSGTDLALLRVESSTGGIEMNATTLPKPGSLALAVGRSAEHGASAAMGIVSTVSGPLRTWRGGMLDHLIKLDMSLYPGLSGAVVADTAGRIHGIATSGLSRFAPLLIPVATIERTIDELLRSGRVARGHIGVGLQPVAIPAALRDKLRLKNENGLIVLSVHPGGPADKAGLVLGDVIVELRGKPLQDTDDVQAAIAAVGIGGKLPVAVLRGGQRAELTITVEERPHRRE